MTAMQVINIDSTNIQPKHWLLISSTIESYLRPVRWLCGLPRHRHPGLHRIRSLLPDPEFSKTDRRSPVRRKPIDLEITDAKTNLVRQLSSLQAATRPTASTSSLTARSLPEPAAKRNAPRATTRFPASTSHTSRPSRTTTLSSTWTTRSRYSDEVTFYHKLDSKVTLLKLIPVHERRHPGLPVQTLRRESSLSPSAWAASLPTRMTASTGPLSAG